jgi:DNA-binding MarR family transcriptional regulator
MDASAERTDDDLPAELGRALARLTRAVARAKALSHADAGRAEYANFALLAALSEVGPMRSSVLADAVFSDPSTVSRQVAHLVDLGYVVRQPDPDDGRACHLAITGSGAEALDAHRRARDDYLARLTNSWSEGDRHTLAALVDRLAGEFTKDLQERGPFNPRVATRRPTRHRQEAS